MVSRDMLGTVISIKAYDDGSETEAAIEKAFEAIGRVGSTMNRFDPTSELSGINKAAGKGWIPASSELFEIIKDSIRYSKETSGAFDITVLPIMKLWNFKAEKPEAPSRERVAKALSLVGCDRVKLDLGGKKILLPSAGMGIDLGGIAKGLAVDNAAKLLRELGVKSAMVLGAGNMAFIGFPPKRDSWRIGIRHPGDRDREIGTLEITGGAVATSGDYERYVIIDGRRYSHIIDPRTGWPVKSDVASVTVVAPTAEEADALSTAVFVMGAKDGMAFIEARADTEAVIVTVGDSGGIKVLLSTGLTQRYRPNE
jgi:thiamine biosynthesis lipoprotein